MWELSDEHEAFRATCRGFADTHLRPIADRAQGDPAISIPVWKHAGALGLLGMLLPDESGEVDGDAAALTVLAEELTRADAGLAITVLGSSYMAATHIGHFGTEAQRRAHLPGIRAGEALASILVTEPGAGSDVAGMTSRATLDGDTWVLNGSKTYITNAGLCSVMVVAARTDADRHNGVTMFVLDPKTPGISVGPALSKMGWHSSDTREVALQDVRIPADAVLGQIGRGFQQIMSAFQLERVLLAGMGLGIAAESLAMAHSHAALREAFGKPLTSMQSIRHRLAEMEVALETARAITYRAADRLDRNHPDAPRSVAIAKYHAARVANTVADDAVQIFGGAGFVEGAGVARRYRDARILRIGGGTDEIQLEILTKDLH